MKCPACQSPNRPGAAACRTCQAPLPPNCAGCGAPVEAGAELCTNCRTVPTEGAAPATERTEPSLPAVPAGARPPLPGVGRRAAAGGAPSTGAAPRVASKLAPPPLPKGSRALGGKPAGPLPRRASRGAAAPAREAAPSELTLDPRFVGREALLARLSSTIGRAVAERRGRFVALTGPPGIGKSRLVRELERRVREALPTARVLVANCGGPGAPPFAAFARLFAQRFGLVDGESPREARARIASAVAERVPVSRTAEVERLIARLACPPAADAGPAPGVPEPLVEGAISEPLAQKPGQLEARTFIAVRRFVAADADRSPLALIFDDVERAAPETIKLIHYLAAGLQDHPVALLVVGRPEVYQAHPSFGQGEAELERIELGPLSPDEAGALLATLVHAAGAPPEALSRHARERLGGSPRALVELVRYLIESGGVARDGEGSWRFDEALSGEPLPATLEELVAARLRALDPAARDLLGKAAACGEAFWFDALVALVHTESLAGPPDDERLPRDVVQATSSRLQREIAATLAQLVQRGLVVESPHARIVGEREFRFAYPPWWEVVYASLDAARRRRYHRLVAQWLELRPETVRPDSSAEQQEDVGRHLERAGDGDGAALRYRRAADAARARYFNDNAIRLYQRALACVGEGDLATRIQLCHDLGSVHQLRGDNENALRACERMLRLAWMCASRTKAAVAFNKIGRIDRQKGELQAALHHLERGLELFRQVDDERGVAGSLDDIAQVLWLLGRYEEALDRGAKALEKRRRLGEKHSIALSLLTIGQIERHRGLFQEAESCYREALAIRRALDDRAGIAASLNGLGALGYQRGDYEGARRSWEEALAIAEEIGALPLVAILEDHLGEAARQLGNLVEARTRFERSEAAARDLDDKRLLSEALRNLGMLELQQGDLGKALDLCQRSYDLAHVAKIPVDAGRALIALGEVHARTLFSDRGDVEGSAQLAERYFREAVDLFREIRNEAELGVALERFGTYTVERGDLDAGKRLLAEAHGIFTRLGMEAVGAEVRRMMHELE